MKEKISIGSKRAIVVLLLIAVSATFFNVFAGQILNLDTVISWIFWGMVPFSMSFVLATRDKRYLNDFEAGMKWYLLSFVIVTGIRYWQNGYSLSNENGIPWQSTFFAMMFAPLAFSFGVIRSHTSSHDLATPGSGILGGLSKLEHPNKRLLTGMLWIGIVVAMALRVLIKQITGV